MQREMELCIWMGCCTWKGQGVGWQLWIDKISSGMRWFWYCLLTKALDYKIRTVFFCLSSTGNVLEIVETKKKRKDKHVCCWKCSWWLQVSSQIRPLPHLFCMKLLLFHLFCLDMFLFQKTHSLWLELTAVFWIMPYCVSTASIYSTC